MANMPLDQTLTAFIQGVFACPAETAAAIMRRASERVYAARAVILREGDVATDTWLVIAGRAQALAFGSEGQLVVLQEYLGGDLFGAIANLDAGPQDAEVVAVETLRAALFLGADFLALFETHRAVGLAVTRQLLRQLRAANGRIAERVTLSAPGRVYAQILRLSGDEAGRRTVSPAPNISRLAEQVQTARETASRAITVLERRGILRREKERWVIVSPRQLQSMVI